MTSEQKTSEADMAIEHLDLSAVRMKLMDTREGEAWSAEQSLFAEREYKRFLKLVFRYRGQSIVPTTLSDTFWHYHILDTRAYHKDSITVFGEYLHHDPRFGMGDADAKLALHAAFQRTAHLYEELFGEPMMAGEDEDPGLSDCKSCKSCRGVAPVTATAQ